MTVRELYEKIDGNYDHAVQIMMMDKMIEKYLQKLADSDVCDVLREAGASMDPADLFESAHAMKGVCANLGLDSLAAMVGEITEEYRPETGRRLSDAEVKAKLEDVYAAFDKTIAGIREYQTI